MPQKHIRCVLKRGSWLAMTAMIAICLLCDCDAKDPDTSTSQNQIDAHTVGPGAVPKSLFVQLSSLPSSTDTVREWFEHVCAHHRDPAQADYIGDLVLQNVADAEGNLFHTQLEIVDDYFDCFDNLFVGTAYIPAFDGGIANADYRWAMINTSIRVMDEFSAKYPTLWFHWYLTYETHVPWLIDDSTKTYTEWFLIEMARQMHQRRPHAAILWSPYIAYPFATLSKSDKDKLRSNLTSMFLNVAAYDTFGDGIRWLHLQDGIGARACQTQPLTAQDAVDYYVKILQRVDFEFHSLALNMEYFVVDCATGGLQSGPLSEHQARESFYHQHGVPVGASWEIRWWRWSHQEM